MAIWNRLTAFITGGAAATAASEALAPEFEVLKQTAWSNEPHRVLPAGVAAEAYARQTEPGLPGINLGGVDLADDAARQGTGSARFRLLTELAQTQPGVGELIRLRRRNMQTNGAEGISDPELTEALRRSGYSPDNVHAIRVLVHEVLDPQQLAAAIHRGLVPDPGLLKGEQPEPPFNVEAYPVYSIDALDEAQAHGYDRDRLGVLVGLQGLPMGTHEAAQALFRGIITHGDYIRAFNESNSRNEWAQAVLEQTRQIPTARDFFENALRGYHSLAWAQEQAKRHGMSEADSLVIYQNQGRPMNLRLITQAISRGGVFKPEPGEITDPYMAAIVEGNLKPAYYDLAYANRYTLPSPFVMRSLCQSGVWSEAKTAQRLKDIGWIPEDADEAAHEWATSGADGSGGFVKRAQTQLWSTAHRSYLAGESDEEDVSTALKTVGVSDDEITEVLLLWQAERGLTRKSLTPTQIKKAWSKDETNPATGAPWTREDAVAALLSRGYSANDAASLLDL